MRVGHQAVKFRALLFRARNARVHVLTRNRPSSPVAVLAQFAQLHFRGLPAVRCAYPGIDRDFHFLLHAPRGANTSAQMQVFTLCSGVPPQHTVKIIAAFSPRIGGFMLDRDLFLSARANFVYAQLELATTYCLLAEQSDVLHLLNYLKTARRTYGNVTRFMWCADLRCGELRDITSDAARLKFRLEALEAQCNGNDH